MGIASAALRAAALTLALAAQPAGATEPEARPVPAAAAGPEADAPAQEPGRGPVTNLPLPRFVSMRAETANARRGPGLDHRVDWTFQRRGMPLEVTAEYGHWRRVRDVEGAGGWVHHSLLSGVRSVLLLGAAPTVLRAGPSEGSATRAVAEPGVVARLESCEGAWCLIAAEGVKGWAPRAALWGVRPDETID